MWEDIERDRQWEVNLQRKDRMIPPKVVPDAVIDSIAHSCGMAAHMEDEKLGKPEEFQRRLRELRWFTDHYFFNYAGMYVGVELDGYMHT